jgi:hypothetical protein
MMEKKRKGVTELITACGKNSTKEKGGNLEGGGDGGVK